MSDLSIFNHTYSFPWPEHPIRDNEPADNALWWGRCLRDIRDATNELASRSEANWHNITAFQNSWTDYSVTTGGGYPTVGWKKSNGEIIMRGMVQDGSASTILTLPTSASPDTSKIFAAVAANGVARITVTTDGLVQLTDYRYGGGNGFVALDGIRFWAS